MTSPVAAEMKEGRELDAEIAEKIFGWLRSRGCGNGTKWDAQGVILVPPDHFKDYRKPVEIPSDPITNFGTTPHFSTDIGAAWEVVAAVQRKNPGWRFSLLGGDQSYVTYLEGGGKYRIDRDEVMLFGWCARFFGHVDPEVNYGDTHGEARADTAPLAICKASLAALRGEGREK